MTRFDEKEQPLLKKIFNTQNPYIELLLDKEQMWVLEGQYEGGRKGWVYSNEKNFPRGISKDDVVGRLLQHFYKEKAIKGIEYGERGTIYVYSAAKDEVFVGDDMLNVLCEMAEIQIRCYDDFTL